VLVVIGGTLVALGDCCRTAVPCVLELPTAIVGPGGSLLIAGSTGIEIESIAPSRNTNTSSPLSSVGSCRSASPTNDSVARYI
jgi:hypothetical protein